MLLWAYKRKIPQEQLGLHTDNEKIPVNHNISPLPDFVLETTEPLKFRPFKPIFHMTMGITECPASELIEFDRNYLSRMALREQIMRDHTDITLQADPSIVPALKELYAYLLGTYLPLRYPTLFHLTGNSASNGHLYNKVTKTNLPLSPPEDPIEAFRLLGENIDEEFVLMTKEPGDDQYSLRGFVFCFPNGFNTKEKFGLKLREIHAPVPGYKEKLEMSMDRFFDRLEVGRVVKRFNWGVTTHGRLYVPSGSHLYDGDDVQEEIVDIENCYLRSERQTLWRLPQTKAIVFSFKTYMYPLQELKDEGSGEALATAIEGLKEGSVPAMNFYKRGVVWGEAVKSFLRS